MNYEEHPKYDINFEQYCRMISTTEPGDDRQRSLEWEYPLYARWHRENVIKQIQRIKKAQVRITWACEG
jgi:hypothetical protein